MKHSEEHTQTHTEIHYFLLCAHNNSCASQGWIFGEMTMSLTTTSPTTKVAKNTEACRPTHGWTSSPSMILVQRILCFTLPANKNTSFTHEHLNASTHDSITGIKSKQTRQLDLCAHGSESPHICEWISLINHNNMLLFQSKSISISLPPTLSLLYRLHKLASAGHTFKLYNIRHYHITLPQITEVLLHSLVVKPRNMW